MSDRRVRFGFRLTRDHAADPVGAARRAEEIGFDIVLVSDHVGPGLAPLPTLAAIAQGTDRIRIGTLVLNNDMRNPLQLAWEAVTLDRLSDGRFELGLGAGHTPTEYAAAGLPFDPPHVRKARLMESVELLRRLFDGETVEHDGPHLRVAGAMVDAPRQSRLPILVGGNGEALLTHAGGHADIVGLQGLGRTLADGHRHDVRWEPQHVDAQVEQVRWGSRGRDEPPEINALVQLVEITDDRRGALAALCGRVDGLEPAHAEVVPYLLVGTVEEVVAHVRRSADRWGITYFAVPALEPMIPVIAAFGEGG